MRLVLMRTGSVKITLRLEFLCFREMSNTLRLSPDKRELSV